jgi:long-subunit acyl-CoA synthetase (AMP-forming)
MRACLDDPGPSVISYLPAAHVVDRIVHHYGQMAFGWTLTDCPDLEALPAHLVDARPTMFVGVPRVWEKLQGGLQAAMAARPELAEGFEAGDPAVLAALRAKVGADRMRDALTGSAPTPLGVLEFFGRLGLTLREVFGMSELGASGIINPAGAERFGTVGKPMAGLEARLAEDGELELRGPALMRGYRGMPEKTAAAISADGWLKTGDIATVDDDGYYRIVDRKKELIISSAGKNMSPANIEGALKSASPLIGQAACIGDARPYNAALLVLDGEAAPAWAARRGLGSMDLAQLADHPYVRKAVGDAVAAANRRLSRVEQIKRWTLLSREWAPGGDELTPTMKLKRKPIAEKYAAEIEAMYRGGREE